MDPSILRFEALVGHFSTYSVVAVGLAGDYNLNGIVDAADYIVWRKTDGTPAGYDKWRANFGARLLELGPGADHPPTRRCPNRQLHGHCYYGQL